MLLILYFIRLGALAMYSTPIKPEKERGKRAREREMERERDIAPAPDLGWGAAGTGW